MLCIKIEWSENRSMMEIEKFRKKLYNVSILCEEISMNKKFKESIYEEKV